MSSNECILVGFKDFDITNWIKSFFTLYVFGLILVSIGVLIKVSISSFFILLGLGLVTKAMVKNIDG